MFKSAILHLMMILNNAKVVKKCELCKFLSVFLPKNQ
nr:MAG TPA: hypothetical protein [Caudoviricetes sp.]